MTELQECGHPADCIRGSDEGTNYCLVCEIMGSEDPRLQVVRELFMLLWPESDVWRHDERTEGEGEDDDDS